MKIELKSLEHSPRRSRETACFEATVYLDGERAGVVSNNGSGAPNVYQPEALYLRLQAHAATQPRIPSAGFEIPCSADILIGRVLKEELARRDLITLLSKHLVYTKADGKLYKRPTTLALWKTMSDDDLAKHLDAAKVLNRMPFDDALEVFITAQAA